MFSTSGNSINIVDMFNRPVAIGDVVIYTVNDRDSGLTYGIVERIYIQDGVMRMRIQPTDIDGTIPLVVGYGGRGEVPRRPSFIYYAKGKIFKVTHEGCTV